MRKIIPLFLIAFLVFSLTVAYGEETKTKYPNEVMAEVDGYSTPPEGPEGEFIDGTKTGNGNTSKLPGEITVFVDGRQVNFPDAKPYIKNGRTLVPIRFVSHEMGAQVEWNNAKREVIIVKNGKKITLRIGSKDVYVNGTKKTIDVPAELKGNRTMVPLRFINEALGAKVSWSDTEKKVTIITTH
ncbi:hypothetical protein AN618_18580 [Fervidicola ferrireducens]|uniref:Copper amine oxidase-like N-terminal domain-containing protein n=1 Tax=Fervidicola ferrireducens TaxID=520764 RepID=A0A140L4L5_9FIRM|nr:copper amine oxidase N-terminal domain-containing protein [Fervidicola ferrireducens]KXG75490.1 hypothetical protein AN618_18580 [Fervidicola ferrireducens]